MSRPKGRQSSIGLGFLFDPAECSRLSLAEKRQFVHEIAQWSKDAPEILSSFTRKELLEVICAEMGEERKYSGRCKAHMIEHLLKLVSQKSNNGAVSLAQSRTAQKRQKLNELEPKVSNDSPLESMEIINEEPVKVRVCQNVACKATLNPEDVFCRRCSCCICYYFDDNKDPSLWLTCSSDSFGENACGLTCHLICALKNKRAGIMEIIRGTKLDGSFCCVSCGKLNGLIESWRKQLLIAKEARRVDVLCLRVLFSYRILAGTEKYNEMQKIVECALQKLKNELGPLDLVCAKMARGIVNRLSCGAEVQNLCASAVEAYDSTISDHLQQHMETEPPSCKIRFEESSPTSVFIMLENVDGLDKESYYCSLWHCKYDEEYPEKPTFISSKPERRFKITDLSPATKYTIRASLFSKTTVWGVFEAQWVTPPLIESIETDCDKAKNFTTAQSPLQEVPSKMGQTKLCSGVDVDTQNEDLRSSIPSTGANSSISHGSFSPSTPYKCKAKDLRERSFSDCERQAGESGYEYSVRVVKWLEHNGHLNEDFRVKFLTWFSLKASSQEKQVVNTFVDALFDDLRSLAEQLMHTFTEKIYSDANTHRPRKIRHGICTHLWH